MSPLDTPDPHAWGMVGSQHALPVTRQPCFGNSPSGIHHLSLTVDEVNRVGWRQVVLSGTRTLFSPQTRVERSLSSNVWVELVEC